MANLLKLFATPVIVDEVPGADEINGKLEPVILAQRGTDVGVRRSNRGGWQSKRDFPQWAGDAGRKIVDHALKLANDYTATARGGPLRWTVDAWANANDPGGFNFPHVHGGTFWSAVYYVRVSGGNGGELVLHDPRMPALRMHAPNLRFKEVGEELLAKIAPSAGRMILFPGWLSHSVEPGDGTGIRVSVAMNIRALPIGA